MASWLYTYFFPAAEQSLEPENTLHIFNRRGLEFDDTITSVELIDENGHLESIGEKDSLSRPIIDSLKNRLSHNQQFQIECWNTEIIIACCFATESFNPHIFFGWPSRRFSRLAESVQQEYWNMILDFATASKAGYVVFVDEASDFEDKFLEINDQRILDTSDNTGYGHGIREIWINKAVGAIPPDGVCSSLSKEFGNYFESYEVR